MRKLLFTAAAAGALMMAAAAPASAQVWVGADPGGAGVQVGPFGFGVGPDYGWRDRDRYYRGGYYAYGSDCRTVRERIRTDRGRTIVRTRRICD